MDQKESDAFILEENQKLEFYLLSMVEVKKED